MPAVSLSRFASLALIALACGSARAQLDWRSTGVEQVSHAAPLKAAPAPPTRAVAPKAPTGAAPTAYAAERAVHTQQVTDQADAILREVNHPRPAERDAAVVQVCHECGCGPTGCQCDLGIAAGPVCDIGGCGEATCGVGCGCGDVLCGDACGAPCGCGGACGGGDCRSRGAVPLVLFVPPIRNLSLSAGVQGFKGPLDGGRDRGNFGFNESIDVSGPMSWLPLRSIGYQIGYRATQSQLHGSDLGDTSDTHTQQFVTAGLFHRQQVGLQYGLVYDFLNDERTESADFGQLRGLIGVTGPRGTEWGFQFTSGVSNDTVGGEDYDPVDQYLIYCRRKNRCEGGELRLFAGVTDGSDGLFGGDAELPLGGRLSLQTGFAYLIPEESDAGAGAEQEHWNLGVNLIWHYGKSSKQAYGSPFRSMFRVADNGSFFVDGL